MVQKPQGSPSIQPNEKRTIVLIHTCTYVEKIMNWLEINRAIKSFIFKWKRKKTWINLQNSMHWKKLLALETKLWVHIKDSSDIQKIFTYIWLHLWPL